MERFTFDLLPQLKGTDILVISFEDLIKDKEGNPRPEDLMDIKHLIAKRKQN